MAGSTDQLQQSLTPAPLTRRSFVRGAADVLVASAAVYAGAKWRSAGE